MKRRTKKMQQQKTRRSPKVELLGIRLYSPAGSICALFLAGRTIDTVVGEVVFSKTNSPTPRVIVYGGKKIKYPRVKIFATDEKRAEYMKVLGIQSPAVPTGKDLRIWEDSEEACN